METVRIYRLGVQPASATGLPRVSSETGHLQEGSPRSPSLSKGRECHSGPNLISDLPMPASV
jgi:hypothetical protein